MKVAYVPDVGAPTGWGEPSPGSASKPWGSPPAIVRSNGGLQLYAAKSGSPAEVHVTLSDGANWGKWRRLPSRATSTRQPAVADVNGDANLVTATAAGLAEEAAQ